MGSPRHTPRFFNSSPCLNQKYQTIFDDQHVETLIEMTEILGSGGEKAKKLFRHIHSVANSSLLPKQKIAKMVKSLENFFEKDKKSLHHKHYISLALLMELKVVGAILENIYNTSIYLEAGSFKMLLEDICTLNSTELKIKESFDCSNVQAQADHIHEHGNHRTKYQSR